MSAICPSMAGVASPTRRRYPNRRTTRPPAGHKVSLHLLRNVAIEWPAQTWSTDITYVPMRHGFGYVVAVMDWHSRCVLSWRPRNNLPREQHVGRFIGTQRFLAILRPRQTGKWPCGPPTPSIVFGPVCCPKNPVHPETAMRHAFNIARLVTNPHIILPTFRAFGNGNRHPEGPNRRTRPVPTKGGVWQRLSALEFVRRWLRKERLTRHNRQWVVNSFVPPFPGIAFERSLRNFIPNQPLTPLSAFLAVTGDCPANCSYCSMKGRRLGRPLTTEQWLAVVDQTLRLGTSLIAFTGGEPLLRPDLSALVLAAHQGGAEVQLFTSGIGATKSRFAALRNAGLWAIGVSLDRADRDSVNKQCGVSGAFESAINAVELARNAGFYTFINAVVGRETVVSGEYRQLYELARRLEVHELRLIEPLPCGQLAAGDNNNCFLEPAHIAELRRVHREMNRRGRLPKVCAFNEIESPELFGCVAGMLHLYIDPAGEVCPCDFTPLSFGNVMKERLDIIWRRMSGSLGLPRRCCFMKANAKKIHDYGTTYGFPLPTAISCQIASESPSGPLPDYFEIVTKPFGFPRNEQNMSGSARD